MGAFSNSLLQNSKAVLRLLVFLLCTGIFLIMFVVAVPLGGRYFMARRWHSVCLKIFAVKLKFIGEMCKDSPVLYVANHVSYIDIIVLGSTLTGSFVSKAEVRKWPMFGWLSTLQNTVFINRKSREIKIQLEELSKRVENKQNLIIFPEGTSTDGKTVKSFKSSLFAICELHPEIAIQPIGLKYFDKKGQQLSDKERDQYAFYADFPFGGHFWGMLKGRGVIVEVMFGQKLASANMNSRKSMAQESHKVVMGLVER